MQASTLTKTKQKTWGGGGVKPLDAAYGKLMMWFFIVSDAYIFRILSCLWIFKI